jgi:hypothetical protein
MSLVQLTPSIGHVRIAGSQAAALLQPLAGQTGAGSAPYTGPWQSMPPGSVLDLTLTLANYTGTLSVILETCNVVVNGENQDNVQFLGAFHQSLGVGAANPTKTNLVTKPCGAFVRVIMTPGTGEGQAADWTVAGQAIAAAFASRT